MNEPFIYIASYQVKPGLLDAARRRVREIAELVEEREPQLSAFHFFLDESRQRVFIVQVHPDADSMATHMAVIADHLSAAWDELEVDGAQRIACGTPPDAMLTYDLEFGLELETYPTHLAGFTRGVEAGTRA
ncbi:hypothetical protein [Agromyces bracchium]|uniref:ABM domain-containing protein n=1 Tax=Agromyces bracchium TaxID=88376 RepID=A0A6I3MIY1_9MICO|nr:hypothetical protein [Agromyces bracchium]MTH70193.1 hypothetical protein [Agromyces bracchium]